MADQNKCVFLDTTYVAAVDVIDPTRSRHVCMGCAAYLGSGRIDFNLCAELPPCRSKDRDDGRNVVFVRVNDKAGRKAVAHG